MRKLRPGVLLVLLSFCLATALSARAGDEIGEDPDAKKVSGKIPVKKFDLSGANIDEPPKKHQPRQTVKEVEATKKKEIVRYKTASLVPVLPVPPQLLLEFPAVARIKRSAEDSPVGRLMKEEMLGRAWRKGVLDTLRQFPPTRKGQPGAGGLIDILGRITDILGGEVVIAVYPPAPGGLQHRVLLVAEMEEKERDTFRDSVGDLKKWAGLGHEASSSTVTSGEFEYERIAFQKREAVSHGFVGNQLVIATGKGLYERVLRAAVSKGDRSVARDEEWAKTRDLLGKNADLYVKLDIKSLVNLATPAEMPAESRKLLKSTLKGLRYVAASLSFSTGAVRERFYVAMEPGSELAKLIPAGGLNESLAKLIPLDAFYYKLDRVEAAALVKSYRMSETFKKTFAPAGSVFTGAELTALARKAGKSMEKDILPALAGDWATAVTITGMGLGMGLDVLVVFQPKDMKSAESVIKDLEAASKLKFRKETYMGAELKFLLPPAEGKSIIPLTAPKTGVAGFDKLAGKSPGFMGPFKAYALAGRYIIMGTSARVVKLAVRQTNPARQGSCIKDKPDFEAVRAKLGTAKNEISMGYLDLRRGGELLYSLAGILGKGLELPPADKVLAELSGMAWSVHRDVSRGRAGLIIDLHSPVGLLPLSAGLGLGGWVKAMNDAAAAEEEAHTRKLKAVWRGLETFATDFGRYPIKLAELYKIYVPNNKDFLTPQQEAAKVKITKSKEVDANTGYRYVTGRSPNSAANSVVMYSIKPNARGWHWCLFANGTVNHVDAKGLPALLGKKE